ncbi:sodium:solute symporter [Streptomyces sp. NPDC002120]|uniref:sodium:solute symporter family protein n=1 Tax=Streptomyces sp. NPDC002120 TaxID=3364631 RepID=UPI0036A58286
MRDPGTSPGAGPGLTVPGARPPAGTDRRGSPALNRGGTIRHAIAAGFVLVVGCAVLAGARRPPSDELPHPVHWALGGRGLGTASTCLLLGGTIYTSYTYIAVPGLMFGTGGLALYALVYTMLLSPLIMILLPRLREIGAKHGLITAADYVRLRHGSHPLALATALTCILATMPYLGLQVVGMTAVLRSVGLAPDSIAGCAVLVVLFLAFALVTQPGGLRACARISLVKAVLIGAAVVVLLALTLARLGSPGHIFQLAGGRGAAMGESFGVPPQNFTAYATLALGSALAQLMYPQVLLVAMASKSKDTLRAATTFLPAWSMTLGIWAFFGVAAFAAGIRTAAGHGELAVPALIRELAPDWLAGLLFGALAVAGLLPAVVMVMSMAMLFVRNIYVEYLNPTATPKHEVRAARGPALAIMAGAIAFALLMKPQDAINLHLLGGVWILQLLPAVAVSLFTRWFHRRALFLGWAVGMVSGTGLLGLRGFSTVVDIGGGAVHAPVYVAVIALALNLAVAALLTPLFDALGVPRGTDGTAGGPGFERRGSKYAFVVE